MKRVQGFTFGPMLFALTICLMLAGIANGQTDLPFFTGKFTLTSQVVWSQTVLQPGDYTITIGSGGMPSFALVRDRNGRPIARFASTIDGGRASAGNALLLGEKGGRLRVHSLALTNLGKVLVYDPILAREAAREARAPQTVPVIMAKQ